MMFLHCLLVLFAPVALLVWLVVALFRALERFGKRLQIYREAIRQVYGK